VPVEVLVPDSSTSGERLLIYLHEHKEKKKKKKRKKENRTKIHNRRDTERSITQSAISGSSYTPFPYHSSHSPAFPPILNGSSFQALALYTAHSIVTCYLFHQTAPDKIDVYRRRNEQGVVWPS
jgi:hypothetical protein